MKDYAKQYLDPRWQKKRLEILEKENWKCEICHDEKTTLHVHHKSYISGNDVWDYPDEYLTCLCSSCHKKEESKTKQYCNEIMQLLKIKFNSCQLLCISQGLKNLNSHISSIDLVSLEIKSLCGSEAIQKISHPLLGIETSPLSRNALSNMADRIIGFINIEIDNELKKLTK